MVYMLVDQDNADIFALFCKSVECLLNLRLLRLPITHEEVLLGIGGLGDVSNAGEKQTCDGTVEGRRL